jgi:hypothetical protein
MSQQPVVITAEEREASRRARLVGPLPDGAHVVGVIEPSASDPRSLTVWFDWHGVDVDRPRCHGISTGRNRKLAERLVAATAAGAIFDLDKVEILRDVEGSTYVSASSKVMGRYLNADLTRLGW